MIETSDFTLLSMDIVTSMVLIKCQSIFLSIAILTFFFIAFYRSIDSCNHYEGSVQLVCQLVVHVGSFMVFLFNGQLN